MNTRKPAIPLLLNVLLLVTLVLAACAPAATPTAAPTAVPQPTAVPTAEAPAAVEVKVAYDIEKALADYLGALPEGFGGIAPAKLNEQIAAAKPFLLDVREAKELTDNGFLEGAVNIPVRTLAQNLDKLPAKDQPIVVYCAVGHRGAIAMVALQLLGYTNVKSLSGGFNAWKAASLPVATGEPAAPAAGAAPDVDKDLLAGLDKYLTGLPEGFGGIAPAKLNEQIAAAKPFLLDVREEKEVASNGYIADSVNIPIRAVFANLSKLPQDKAAPIVVYCAVGHRGAIAMVALQLIGYTNVKSLSGGFNAWKAAELPVAGAPAPAFDIAEVVNKYVAALPEGFGGIAPAKLNEQIAAAKPFLLDVREAKELTDNGFLEGAVNIPIRTLAQNLDKLPAKDQPIVVYCAIGHRGAIAMVTLQLLGYTNVKSLSGGFNAWKAANLPVATGEPAAPAAGAKPEVNADLLAALDKYLTTLPDGFSGITPAKLNEQMAVAKPFLLDVREAKELADNGYIEGAVNIPMRSLTQSLDKLPAKDQPIVVYCAVGHRGGIAMMALQLLGYTNVKSMTGGFNAWKAAELPIVK